MDIHNINIQDIHDIHDIHNIDIDIDLDNMDM